MNTLHKTQSWQRRIWTRPHYFLAFGFGSGLLPYVPGTWGTLFAIPLYLLIQNFSPLFYGIVVAIAFFAGIWMCDVAERAVGIPDYTPIVWDEIVGYLITMFIMPHGWVWIILGFFLFRLFDIWKPWPIRWIDGHVKGGFGIMLDDVLAAVYAWIVLRLLVVIVTLMSG